MQKPFDDGEPDIPVINTEFPGLLIPSEYDKETGRPTPNKPVRWVNGIWLFKGIGDKLQDKWMVIVQTGGSENYELYTDVIGARTMVKNGAAIGLDIETNMERIQGYPQNIWETLP